MTAPVVRTRVSAYAVVVDGGRLLLARLAASSPVFAPGLWHLPGGGIDPGEQPVEALARELREETGLELGTARLWDARTYDVERGGVRWQLTGLFYAVEPKTAGAATVAEADGSTDAVRWLPLAELDPATLSPAAADALRLLASAL
ncbi:NUDIX hydrolase [Streptomyces sp. NPDC127092]|uniref:NUDIX hydrolase n=1 Tax=Streptomyces sp. NPDC127092 TaxID=3347135 RepID=UPI003651815E